jgi:hypothetical protein
VFWLWFCVGLGEEEGCVEEEGGLVWMMGWLAFLFIKSWG